LLIEGSIVPPLPSGEQTTVAPFHAVQEAELKLQVADFLAADQLVQKWLSERFGGAQWQCFRAMSGCCWPGWPSCGLMFTAG